MMEPTDDALRFIRSYVLLVDFLSGNHRKLLFEMNGSHRTAMMMMMMVTAMATSTKQNCLQYRI